MPSNPLHCHTAPKPRQNKKMLPSSKFWRKQVSQVCHHFNDGNPCFSETLVKTGHHQTGGKIATGVVLATEEMERPASTHLDCTLRPTTTSYISISEKRRKEVVSKSWDKKNELVDVLNGE